MPEPRARQQPDHEIEPLEVDQSVPPRPEEEVADAVRREGEEADAGGEGEEADAGGEGEEADAVRREGQEADAGREGAGAVRRQQPAADRDEGRPDGNHERAASPARELTRKTGRRRSPTDTGRRHHIGAVPEFFTVLRPDGTTGTTRTAPAQLADRTDHQLARLAERIERDMARAAADLDFEGAAHQRDELEAARAEIARREGHG